MCSNIWKCLIYRAKCRQVPKVGANMLWLYCFVPEEQRYLSMIDSLEIRQFIPF